MRREQQRMAAARALARVLMFFLVHRLVGAGDDAFSIVTFVEFGDADAAAYRDRGTAKIDKILIEHPFDLFGPADSHLTATFGEKNVELIAADACHAVVFADLQLQQLADGTQLRSPARWP